MKKEAIVIFFDDKDPLLVVGEMSKAEFGQYAAKGCAVRAAIYNKHGIPFVLPGYRVRSAYPAGDSK